MEQPASAKCADLRSSQKFSSALLLQPGRRGRDSRRSHRARAQGSGSTSDSGHFARAKGGRHVDAKRRLGPALLKEALLRADQAADTIGARAVLVHAKDDDARDFYAHFDFEPSPSDPYHMLLIMKDVLKNIGRFRT